MHWISLGARGNAKNLSTPTVWMGTGTGSIDSDGRMCLSYECCSEIEIDECADLMKHEIEEWRKAAKRELRKRKKTTR